MSKTITALQDTVLKHSPVDSTLLADNEKSIFRRGATYPIVRTEVVGTHVKFWLGKDDQGKQVWINNRQIWFAFAAHVQVDGENSGRKISDKGLALIKKWEGLRLEPYYCSGNVLTIGYGSTGPHVQPGVRIAEEMAEDLLKKDVERFERAVNELVKVPLTQAAFDSLCSFAFNMGEGALASSTLLRLLNQGEYKAAADQLVRWVNAGGKELEGLRNRRREERALWLSEPSPLSEK